MSNEISDISDNDVDRNIFHLYRNIELKLLTLMIDILHLHNVLVASVLKFCLMQFTYVKCLLYILLQYSLFMRF